jgi:hypothetical protein
MGIFYLDKLLKIVKNITNEQKYRHVKQKKTEWRAMGVRDFYRD